MGDILKHPRMKSVVCLGTLALVFVLALGEGSQNNYEAIESKVFDRLIRDAGRKEGQNQKSRKGSRKNKPKKKAGKRLRQRRKKGNGKAKKQSKKNKGKGKRIGKSKCKN